MNEVLRTDLALISEWIQPASHVLDLGCGSGRLLAHLGKQKQVTGYGLEINPEKILACIERGVQVIHTDLNQGLSEFADQSCDYVVMSSTIQAIRRPDRLLEEMLRVGREGIVTFPNFGHWSVRYHLFFQGKMPRSRALPNPWYNTDNIHLCTVRDFESLCRDLNIEVLERMVVDPSHQTRRLMSWLPNLMGEVAMYRLCRGDV